MAKISTDPVKWFAEKKVEMPDVFYSLSNAEKLRSFTFSGAANIDQVTFVFHQLRKVLESGGTFQEFKKLVKSGELAIDLPDYRLNNIFRTNIQTAYNRGHFIKQLKFKDDAPYGMYSAIDDERVRPDHLAFNHIIMPIDDPRWLEIYPPNGYQCRCGVISLTKEQAKKRMVYTMKQVDEILAAHKPDKGWDFAPNLELEPSTESIMEPVVAKDEVKQAVGEEKKNERSIKDQIEDFAKKFLQLGPLERLAAVKEMKALNPKLYKDVQAAITNMAKADAENKKTSEQL